MLNNYSDPKNTDRDPIIAILAANYSDLAMKK